MVAMRGEGLQTGLSEARAVYVVVVLVHCLLSCKHFMDAFFLSSYLKARIPVRVL